MNGSFKDDESHKQTVQQVMLKYFVLKRKLSGPCES
jgi:hypothetical protein